MRSVDRLSPSSGDPAGYVIAQTAE